MEPAIELGIAIRTTGAVRRFTDDPVDDATLYALLDDARFAPSGGNRQGWRVAVIANRAKRVELGRMMQRVWNEYVQAGSTGHTPFNVIDAPKAEARDGAPEAPSVPNDLIEGIADIPVVLVVAADLGQIAMMDSGLDRPTITGGASIYPFCWNLLLAARSRGLGGVITTFLARAEPQAAPLLGLTEGYAIAATIFIGHPVHQPTRLSRVPVESFSTVDSFVGEAFRG
jgi:nitroreductase